MYNDLNQPEAEYVIDHDSKSLVHLRGMVGWVSNEYLDLYWLWRYAHTPRDFGFYYTVLDGTSPKGSRKRLE